jgi:hypothetical protein
MFELTITKQFLAGSEVFTHAQVLPLDRLRAVEQLVPVAQAGTLTTRTSGTAGTLTMASSGHGITTGSRVDFYWLDGSGVTHFARNALVGSVAGASVPFTAAAGEALPAAQTPVQAAIVQSFSFPLNGAELEALLGGCDFAACQIVLLDSSGPVEHLVVPLQPGECYGWTGDWVNPLAGVAADTVHLSHNDTAAARAVRVLAGLTPEAAPPPGTGSYFGADYWGRDYFGADYWG